MTDSTTDAWRVAVFRKSSYSGQNAQCVEVARAEAMIGVRDSKNPVGPVLALAAERGHLFLAAIKRERITAP
jgi:hypothetical protein